MNILRENKTALAVFNDVLATFKANQPFIASGVTRAIAGDNSEIIIGDLHDGEILSFIPYHIANKQCEITIRSRCEVTYMHDIQNYFNQVNTFGYEDFVFNQHESNDLDKMLLAANTLESVISIHLHFLHFNANGQYTASIFIQLQ